MPFGLVAIVLGSVCTLAVVTALVFNGFLMDSNHVFDKFSRIFERLVTSRTTCLGCPLVLFVRLHSGSIAIDPFDVSTSLQGRVTQL